MSKAATIIVTVYKKTERSAGANESSPNPVGDTVSAQPGELHHEEVARENVAVLLAALLHVVHV